MLSSEIPLFTGFFQSPIGKLTIISDGSFITTILFPKDYNALPENENGIILDCFTQLEEYFKGERKFFDLPLNPKGTDFQKKVWGNVRSIPIGETISYSEIACLLGNSKLNRAVGLANGANPIPIIIPCHRVIGSNGCLTGYAGGLEIKRYLLNHEQQFSSATKGQLKLF